MSEVSGNFRLGYLASTPDSGQRHESFAVGGALTYHSASWQGFSAAGTLYSSQKLFSDDHSAFFGADGTSYTIVGQAYMQANIANTEFKVGRFGFDSPHLDMDDVRMVPNTFSGILVTNTSISDSTIYLAHLDKWSGISAPEPETFTDIAGSKGVNILGVVYHGVEHLSLQSWFYHADNLANLAYLEASVEIAQLTWAVQYGKQVDNRFDKRGPDGDVFGVSASYSLDNFSFSAAYNQVWGTIIDGFGGGPFFTSAADHTIGDVKDQSALAVGVAYTGIDNLTISLLNVAFDKGADELDLTLHYDFGNDIVFDFIYHHMQADGDMALALLNVGF
ncbi:outer membrane porin, OprD family [Colwellia chukchiensis]|uniref:Outer membrane porin, OprD family n=1 Tax=Colwellia chukchiensis TaxID=641665 RepID=A0A1H7NDJ4_9GAMM|nr:OprD family outer membrane porin [Colwellia chukchiensis]SEL21359.1 outer membrane porin, OprD family [Colwellia chukchiensis]